MLLDKKGNIVKLPKGASAFHAMPFLEKKWPETPISECPGGFFELGKRVKYGKRGHSPQEIAAQN